MKAILTEYQKAYLAELRQGLSNLDSLGKSGTAEWWSIAESIDSIENNL